MRRMRAHVQLEIVPGATHLFEEPGALELVSQLALRWCTKYLKGPHSDTRSPCWRVVPLPRGIRPRTSRVAGDDACCRPWGRLTRWTEVRLKSATHVVDAALIEFLDEGPSLCARRPCALRIQQTDIAAVQALEIETLEGQFIRLAFRATALPEQLDGLAPSEVDVSEPLRPVRRREMGLPDVRKCSIQALVLTLLLATSTHLAAQTAPDRLETVDLHSRVLVYASVKPSGSPPRTEVNRRGGLRQSPRRVSSWRRPGGPTGTRWPTWSRSKLAIRSGMALALERLPEASPVECSSACSPTACAARRTADRHTASEATSSRPASLWER